MYVVSVDTLDVYESPNKDSKIIGTLHKDVQVQVELLTVSDVFVYICTVYGFEGYCMKDGIRGL